MINETEQLLNKNVEGDDNGDEIKSTLSVLRQRLMFVTILLLQLSTLCTDTLILPFFPVEAKIKGLSPLHIGIVFSGYEFSRFVASPIAAALLTKCRLKYMCLYGTGFVALTSIGFGFMEKVPNNMFLPLCLVIRLIAGAGSAMLTVASTSILLTFSSFSTNTVISSIEIMQGAGYALGPVVGAALFELLGYKWMFISVGILIILNSIVVIFVVPNIVDKTKKKEESALNSLKMATIPGVAVMLVQCFGLKVINSARFSSIGGFISSAFHKSPSTIGLLFGIWSAIYIISCLVSSRIADKGYFYTMIIISWIIYLPACLIIGPATPLYFICDGEECFWWTVVGFGFVNIVEGALFIAPFQAALNLAIVNGHETEGVQTYGMITGLINSAWSLGSVTGPILAGGVTQALSYAWTSNVLGLIVIVMLALLIGYLVWMRLTNQLLAPPTEQPAKDEYNPLQNSESIKGVDSTLGSLYKQTVENSPTLESHNNKNVKDNFTGESRDDPIEMANLR